MDVKKELDKIKQTLATERDELRVKAHLLTKEVTSEWEDVEKKWDNFQLKASNVAEAGQEGMSEVYEATKLLGNEIGGAYQRIRKAL